MQLGDAVLAQCLEPNRPLALVKYAYPAINFEAIPEGPTQAPSPNPVSRIATFMIREKVDETESNFGVEVARCLADAAVAGLHIGAC